MQPDGSLVISRVTVEDGGFYTCVAFNGHDRDQRWVQLRVQSKEEVLSGGAMGVKWCEVAEEGLRSQPLTMSSHV